MAGAGGTGGSGGTAGSGGTGGDAGAGGQSAFVEQSAYVKADDVLRTARFGANVDIGGDLMVVGAPGAPSIGRAHLFERIGGVWREETSFPSSVGGAAGGSVATDGETVVVGAPSTSPSGPLTGYAFIYERSQGEWVEVEALSPPPDEDGVVSEFGHSVAVDGDRVVIGELSRAHVYERSSTGWTLTETLSPPDAARNVFGWSVAIDGDTIAVGDPGASSSSPGRAFVYQYESASEQWVYQELTVEDRGDFGHSVSLSGDTLAVTAPRDDGGPQDPSDGGSVYVFARDGGVWRQTVELRASNASEDDWLGGAIERFHYGDGFVGVQSVDVLGDVLVVGARHEDGSSSGVDGPDDDQLSDAGAAYVFRRLAPGDWVPAAYLKASNPDREDLFGSSVATDGATVVVGALGEDSPDSGFDADQGNGPGDPLTTARFDSGAVYLFGLLGSGGGGTGGQGGAGGMPEALDPIARIVSDDGVEKARFSNDFAIDGDRFVVSAVGQGIGGAAYVFVRSANTFVQEARLFEGDPPLGRKVHPVVQIDGDTVAVAATETSGAGGIYVFRRVAGAWQQEGYLKPSNVETFQCFRQRIVIQGDTLVTAAACDRDDGSIYVFKRSDGEWSEQARLMRSTRLELGDPLPQFGATFSFEGDTILGIATEASPLRAGSYIFRRSGDQWQEEARVEGRGNLLSEDLLEIRTDAGFLRYARNAGDWVQSEPIPRPPPALPGELIGKNVVASVQDGVVVVQDSTSGPWVQERYAWPEAREPNAAIRPGDLNPLAVTDEFFFLGVPSESPAAMDEFELLGPGAVYVYQRP